MLLDEFIKNALIDIVKGVNMAKEELSEQDVIFNPSRYSNNDKIVCPENGYRAIQQIEMNIAVSVEEKAGSKTGIGVVTGLFSAGGSSNNEGVNKTVSTLKFSIPISLPSHKASS